MRRSNSEGVLGTRERLCLFHGTNVSAEAALSMDYEEITFKFLLESGVTHVNLSAAGVGPRHLKRIGLESASELRRVGFDALYLSDQKFLDEAVAEFGADEIVSAYLVSASDAVAISGSGAVDVLGISTATLLQECAGAAQEAYAVLQQLPRDALSGVTATVVLDTGLRKSALSELGYSLTTIARQTKANAFELSKLGF